jgi:hypothetical protein
MGLRSDGGGMNLRGDDTPKETKLVVIDTRKWKIKGYEGRFHCSEFNMDVDGDTDAGILREVIEEVRVSSSKEAVIAGNIEHQRHEPGRLEYESWFQ